MKSVRIDNFVTQMLMGSNDQDIFSVTLKISATQAYVEQCGFSICPSIAYV